MITQGTPIPPAAIIGMNVSPSLSIIVQEKVWGSYPNCPQVSVRGRYIAPKDNNQAAKIISKTVTLKIKINPCIEQSIHLIKHFVKKMAIKDTKEAMNSNQSHDPQRYTNIPEQKEGVVPV